MANDTQIAEINFLRVRKRELSEVEKKDKKYAIWMGYVCGAVGVLFVVVSVIEYILTTQLQRLDDRQEQVQGEIAQQRNIEEQFISLAEKLQFIVSVLKKKANKREAIEYFTTNFSNQETSLKEITYDDAGVLQFQVVSNDICVFNRTVDTLRSSELQSRFQSISLSDVARTQNGQYSVHAVVVLGAPVQESSPVETPPLQ